MSLIYTRVLDQRIRDHIDMLQDAEYTLMKYLHLGETQELSEANAEAFNPQSQTTDSVHALRYPKKRAKGQEKAQVNYAHIVVLVISLINAQLKRQSVKFVNRLLTMQKFVEINAEKQNKMTGQIISLLDLQETRGKAPIFTWWQMMGK